MGKVHRLEGLEQQSVPNKQDARSKNGQVAQQSFMLSALLLVSASLELLRDIAVAWIFGVGAVSDAFFLAIVIPVTVTGALQSVSQTVLLPWFGTSLAEGSEIAEERLGLLFILSLLPSLGILAATVVGAPLIATIIVGSQINQELLTAGLHFALPVLGISLQIAVVSAYLNAAGKYKSVALRRAANNVTFLIGVLLLGKAHPSTTLGLAFLLGFLVELGSLLLQTAQIMRLRTLRRGWRHLEATLTMLRLSLFPAFVFLVARGNLVFERVIAGYLGVGSVTAVTYARRTTLAIGAIVAQGINTITLSEMSKLKRGNATDRKEQQQILDSSIRLTLLILIPVAIILAVFHQPLTTILFAGRRMDAVTALRTGQLLLIFGASLPFYILTPLIQSAFYADGDAKTPSFQKVVSVLFNLGTTLLMVRWLGTTGIGVSFLITMVLATGWAWLSVQQRYSRFTADGFAPFVLKICSGGVLCIGLSYMSYHVLTGLAYGFNQVIFTFINLVLAVSLSLICLALVLKLWQISEVTQLWFWLQRKLRNANP